MVGTTVSHYKILQRLGGGGMGVVYKAQDTRLKRTVALKFLSPEPTRSPLARERFIHEAQAASALQHANICVVHDIDQTADGRMFIAMEYLEGETLKEKIRRAPLPLDDAVRLAIQIAQALAKAHEHGIVHRDINPANVMVTTDGVAKIVDFGLAKLAGSTVLTKTGSTFGTVAYMSPEQARGEAVDHRTDIWSLGIVLYEMVTGQPPFKGEYENAVIYAVLNCEPKPVTALRTGVPLALEDIVRKCAAKRPDERYQHVDDLLVDLRRLEKVGSTSAEGEAPPERERKRVPGWRGPLILAGSFLLLLILALAFWWIFGRQKDEASLVEKRKAIAVLPFIPITSSEEDRSFADGIHEDILTQLGKIRDLTVIARTSVMQYRGSSKTIREVAKDLGVGSVLEGSTRRVGDSIRIVAQLVDGATQAHLWAETYDRPYADIFAVQSDVARKIAGALKAELTSEERASIAVPPTTNLGAYEYFKKGVRLWEPSFEVIGNVAAAEMFEKAVALDSTFSLAYAMITRAYADAYNVSSLPMRKKDEQYRLKAEEALARAERLIPSSPEVHLARGIYLEWIRRDYNGAIAEFETVRAKRPNDFFVLMELANALHLAGRSKAALEICKRLLVLDPRNPYVLGTSSWVAFRLEDYADSEEWADALIAESPDDALGYLRKMYVLIYGYGRPAEAEKVFDEAKRVTAKNVPMLKDGHLDWVSALYVRDYGRALALANTSDDPERTLLKAHTYDVMGRSEEARVYYDSARATYAAILRSDPDNRDARIRLAAAYAGGGRKNEALREVALLEHVSDVLPTPDYQLRLATIHLMIAERGEAVRHLAEAVRLRSTYARNALRLDPRFDRLRNEPDFQRLVTE